MNAKRMFVGLALLAGAGWLSAGVVSAGPYTEPGYTAGELVAWATEVSELTRGPMDIAEPELGDASYGIEGYALGPISEVMTETVSLGDGGSITLGFETGIGDGEGVDFAVFENGFWNSYGLFAEFAYVEVSTDGVQFARFDSIALNDEPVPSFAELDPTDYYNLAGDQAAGLGTGFDLAELADHPLVQSGAVDLADIGYVRLVDVIGDGSTDDGDGRQLWDPYATAFPIGGFDIDAVGVRNTAVPEPGAMLMLCAGVLALFALGRLRRQAPLLGACAAEGARVQAPVQSRWLRCTRKLRFLPYWGLTTAAIPRLASGLSRHLGHARPLPRRLLAVGFLSTLAVFGGDASAATADLEDLGLGAESYYDGSDGAGGFISSGVLFENNYNQDWGSWDGFAASTTTDTETGDYSNQYSAIPGGGAGGSATYAVGFWSSFAPEGPLLELESELSLGGVFLTNTTYAYVSMRDGDLWAKKFGGVSGDDPDWFLLGIQAFDAGGAQTGSLDFYLADFRFADSDLDYILGDWTFLDLSTLGPVKSLRFSLSSSDNGDFGMNTPAYFALDRLSYVPEPGVGLLVGLGLVALGLVQRRSRDS